jgi:hypothetical protein
MQIKKTIWIPVIIGIVSAAIILLVSEAQFVIPLGNNYSIGIGEIFNTLSAALGGPIAVIITVLVTGIGHYLLNMNLYTETWFTNLALADAFIHMFAMLLVAICYYRVLYLRTRKISVFIGGWWLTIGVYYYLALLPLQVALLNYVDPGFGASYPSFAKIFFPEFLGTAAITTLIWLASPARYRRPQWISPKGAPDHSDEIQTNGKKVHNDR